MCVLCNLSHRPNGQPKLLCSETILSAALFIIWTALGLCLWLRLLLVRRGTEARARFRWELGRQKSRCASSVQCAGTDSHIVICLDAVHPCSSTFCVVHDVLRCRSLLPIVTTFENSWWYHVGTVNWVLDWHHRQQSDKTHVANKLSQAEVLGGSGFVGKRICEGRVGTCMPLKWQGDFTIKSFKSSLQRTGGTRCQSGQPITLWCSYPGSTLGQPS